MFERLLNFIFPKPKKVSRLEETTPGALLKKARLATDSPEPWIENIFMYKDPVIHDLVWQLKFHRNKKVAKLFADIISDHLAENISDDETFSRNKTVIIPIPSSKTRMRKKGFNQTFLICNYLQTVPVCKNILVRKKHSLPQSHIKNRGARLENIRGCFSVQNTDDLKNKNIILLDDVTTTGATLREARNALKKHGAKTVTAITIAH